MTTPAVIRPALPRDAFAVAALHLQCARAAGAAPDPGFLDRWADAWLRAPAVRPHWLAEIENRPLGVIGLHLLEDLPAPGQERGDRWARVSFLYVSAPLRRCGIAGQLVREVATWSQAEGLARLVADLGPLGAAGAGLARRLGAADAPAGLVAASLRRPVTVA